MDSSSTTLAKHNKYLLYFSLHHISSVSPGNTCFQFTFIKYLLMKVSVKTGSTMVKSLITTFYENSYININNLMLFSHLFKLSTV